MRIRFSNIAAGLMLLLPAGLPAQSVPVYFNQSDGISRQVWFSEIDSARFLQDNTVGQFFMERGKSMVSYYLNGCLDSISFSTPKGDVADFPVADELTVEMASSDDNSFKNVKESVETNESRPGYGDFVENYVYGNTITITYSGDKATASTSVKDVDVRISGAHVTVNSTKGKMRYVLKGSTSNGSFKIDSEKKFRLDLSGVSITNPDGAAINIQSGKSIYMVLTSGTENKLTDGKQYVYVGDEDQKGALFSEGQLLISGAGSLKVTSQSAHGICSDDYIRLRGNLGTLTVNAAVDGINTKQHFIMYGGKVSVTAGDDGVVVRRGHIQMMGGKLTVKAVDNGIDATYSQNDTTYFSMGGGLLKVETSGDKGHGISSTGNMTISGGIIQAVVKGAASKAINCYGDITMADAKATLMTQGVPMYNEEEADFSSAAGIRCRGNMSLTNSIVGIKSTGQGGKGFNCDGNASLSGSDVTVVTSGGSYAQGGESVRPKTLECMSLTLDSGSIRLNSSYSAIQTHAGLAQNGGEIYAFSTHGTTQIINAKAGITQTGGLLYQRR